jgi:hypothetical protein
VEPTVPPTVEPTVPPTVEPTVPPTVEPTVPPTVPPAPGNVKFRVKVEGHHGAIRIEARGGHGSMTASAVAHFSTGDVTVQLKRDGKSKVKDEIRIPRRQTAGEVTIDITIVSDGVTQAVITKTVKVRGSDRHDD